MISASASSVYVRETKKWGPQFAWKGRSHEGYQFYHSTINEFKPWLLIQIPRVQLRSVTIINRYDCCGQRLKNLQVRAGVNPGLKNEVVGTFKGPGETGKEYLIPFDREVTAEYISFQIMEKGTLQVNGIKVNE